MKKLSLIALPLSFMLTASPILTSAQALSFTDSTNHDPNQDPDLGDVNGENDDPRGNRPGKNDPKGGGSGRGNGNGSGGGSAVKPEKFKKAANAEPYDEANEWNVKHMEEVFKWMMSM